MIIRKAKAQEVALRKQAIGRLKRRRSRWGYLFILPWIIGFFLFFAVPLVQSFIDSLNIVTMGADGFKYEYVGFSQYEFMLFQDPKFMSESIGPEVVKLLYKVPLIVILSLFIAVILNQKFPGRTFFRSAFFLPVILTSGVAYVLLHDAINGASLVNTTSETNLTGLAKNTLGASQGAYMFSTGSLRDILIMANVPIKVVNAINSIVNAVFSLIMESGVQILLFLSGLQKIPASSYEAARIEGASEWDSFWKITVPLMAPIMFLNVIYSILDSFLAYGNDDAGNKVMAAIYNVGYRQQFQFGRAATMAWIYMVVIIIVLALAFLIFGRIARKVDS